MNFTRQAFLLAYESLSSPSKAKQANNYIMRLEKSHEAWQIAYQLLESASQNQKLLGAQLLSKKSNNIQTDYMPPSQLIGLILSKIQQKENVNDKKLKAQLCLSISKLIILKKQDFKKYITNLLETQDITLALNILKEVPQSLVYKSELYSKDQIKSLFGFIQPYLAKTATMYQELTLECIQNFIQFQRINILCYQSIAHVLITLPLQSIESILMQCYMKYEKCVPVDIFNALTQLTVQPLLENANVNRKSYIDMFLNFGRFYINVAPVIQPKALELILYYTLAFISNDRQLIVETFEFWQDLSCLYEKGHQALSNMINAITELNKLVIQKSLLKRLISREQERQAIQIISDEDEDTQDDNFDEALNLISTSKGADNDQNSCLTYRQYAVDFLRLCYKIIKNHPDKLIGYYQMLGILCNSNELELELCIFIIKSIVDSIQQNQYQYLKPIFLKLMSVSHLMAANLLVPLIQMLTDFDIILSKEIELMNQSLKFILSTLSNPQVCRLGSQTLNNIISSIQSPTNEVKSSIQELLSLIYNQYEYIQDEIVLQNVTNSLICLIQKLENPQESYKVFLSTFYAKTKSFEGQKLIMFYKSLYFGHLALVSNPKLDYELAAITRLVYVRLLECFYKKEIKKRVQIFHIFNSISKKCGRYIPEAMIEASKIFLNDTFNKDLAQISALYFFSNVLTNYNQSPKEFAEVIQIWETLRSRLITIPDRPQITKLIIEFSNKLVEVYNSAGLTEYACLKLKTSQFNYQMYREIFKYFLNLIRKGLYIDIIINCIITVYSKVKDTFFQLAISCIIEAYKISKALPFLQAFRSVKPELNQSNPLTLCLFEAIEKTDSMSIKNILQCLP